MEEDTKGVLILLSLLCFIFLAGFVWCVCCGTCIGRQVLREFGFQRCIPTSQDDQWQPVSLDDVEMEPRMAYPTNFDSAPGAYTNHREV
ncbi:hypothetical protein K493DRAFT_309926 [Basidiobolus meristosporus CBS 931.73]|uniref:Uncharacterized protein n=1 Tax=Basidiobolus meristosporus CBS 931.73 TaxID=1314790 RepID=A0A1Y1ZD37_9FUNG|nr:hypothetical protein K493DRAFT_309926 [Basidiobolus meristosporus CBS 931.73]|eukprot:ORY08119.1 hypothetical protein K493DRAFT_309926 [Basidiobolus meristosporus CBS 931.73]